MPNCSIVRMDFFGFYLNFIFYHLGLHYKFGALFHFSWGSSGVWGGGRGEGEADIVCKNCALIISLAEFVSFHWPDLVKLKSLN